MTHIAGAPEWMKTAGVAGTGMVDFSLGSPAVVGSGGSLFTTEFAVGDILFCTIHGIVGRVLSITDNTHLTLDANARYTLGGAGVYRIIKKVLVIVGDDGVNYDLKVPVGGFYSNSDSEKGTLLVPGPAVVPAGNATPAWGITTAPAVAPAPTVRSAAAWMAGGSPIDVVGQDGVNYTLTPAASGPHTGQAFVPAAAINAALTAGWTLV